MRKKVARQQRKFNALSAPVTVVPTIIETSANLVRIVCPVCGSREHRYLRTNALDPQHCPLHPEVPIALCIIVEADSLELREAA